VLDVLATDDMITAGEVRVDDAGLTSDHRLVVYSLSTSPHHNNIAVDKPFRRIRNVNVTEFEQALRQMPLFTSPATTVDGFADQIEADVVAVLDKFASLHRSRRRPSKPVTRWLSTDAIDS